MALLRYPSLRLGGAPTETSAAMFHPFFWEDLDRRLLWGLQGGG